MEAYIHPDLVGSALSKTHGFGFESFANQFFSALLGATYVPLGGVKDGGADGFAEETIYEVSGKTGRFFQASSELNYQDKIERTIERLKEFGREPHTIWYVTNRIIQHSDLEEEKLSDLHDVTIKIRDSRYICNHINDSEGTRASYYHWLAQVNVSLQNVGASAMISANPHVSNPAPYVFLAQEVGNRLGNKGLIQTVCDSLILWALNDTDPANGRFRSREEVRVKIVTELPWAKHYINQQIDQRLAELSRERTEKGIGRKIQFHKLRNSYCLPYETRSKVAEENASDELLKEVVRSQFLSVCQEMKFPAKLHDEIADVCFRTLEVFFEKQGLLFVEFLNKKSQNGLTGGTVSTFIGEVLEEVGATPAKAKVLAASAFEILRRCFYQSTREQRDYLSRLSRTFVLLFTMRGDPRIVEFFQNQARGYRIFVGTDVLLVALTERYVPEADQRARTLLAMARDYGCKLYLTEPILEEIYTHFRATDFEFQNHFSEREPFLTRELISHSDRILIRTYFYAKFEGKVNGWKKFISSFADHSKIRTAEGREQLKSYLINQFNLEFLDNQELTAGVKVEDVDKLAKSFIESGFKDREDLAKNDAIMVHSVYAFRRRHSEMAKHGEFGYRTWWLTHETLIQRATAELVMSHHGARYIMRPAFLLNYFSLCPSSDEIKRTYREIFPSVLGLQMGHRIDSRTYHDTLAKVDEWRELEEGRRAAKIAELSDRLRTDHLRIHDFDLADPREHG
ncbi:hypothetical protein PQQ87_17995 [Paraburkholderia nemoris]|uniref:hypothetical protein n=1 Tax=Paraburkholderia nemoris TaxID=2793076 RepID=UPI0038B7E4BE